MAGIGLSRPYMAVYAYDADTNTVTYTNGGAIGKAVSLSMSLNSGGENVLYADNGPAESDNQFGGGTLTLTTDELRPDVMAQLLGVSAESVTLTGATSASISVYNFGDSQVIPYVGVGAVRKVQLENQVKWQAYIFPKMQFQNVNEAFTTQGETIEWQTPELNATMMRDDTTNHNWKMISSLLDTEADAVLFIKNFLA